MSPSATEEAGDSSLAQNLLYQLEKHNQLDTFEYAETIKEDHQKVVGAVKSLEAVEGVCIIGFIFRFILLPSLSSFILMLSK